MVTYDSLSCSHTCMDQTHVTLFYIYTCLLNLSCMSVYTCLLKSKSIFYR